MARVRPQRRAMDVLIITLRLSKVSARTVEWVFPSYSECTLGAFRILIDMAHGIVGSASRKICATERC